MLGGRAKKRSLKQDAVPKNIQTQSAFKAMHFKPAPDRAERRRRRKCNLQFSPATSSLIKRINLPLEFIWENNVIKGKGKIKEIKHGKEAVNFEYAIRTESTQLS